MKTKPVHKKPLPSQLEANETATSLLEAKRFQLANAVLTRLNHYSTTADTIRDVVSILKENLGVDAVGIRMREGHDFPYYSQNGFSEEFLRTENTLLCCSQEGCNSLECTCGLVLSGKVDATNPLFTAWGSFWSNYTQALLAMPAEEDPRLHPRNRCIHDGYLSVALIPLRAENEILGLLQVNDRRPNLLTLDMIHSLEELGISIGIALKRAQVEESLRKSQAMLNATGQMAKVGGWEVQLQTQRLIWTDETYRIHEVSQDFKPTVAGAIDFYAPESKPVMAESVKRAMEHGEAFDLQLEIITAMNRRRWVHVKGQALTRDGTIIGISGTFQDITEYKQLEELLRKMTVELESRVEERFWELRALNTQLLQEKGLRLDLERELLEISERERSQIGQDLHDSVGQSMAGVGYLISAVQQKLSRKGAPEAAELERVRSLVEHSVLQVRQMAHTLYPAEIDKDGLIGALQELVLYTQTVFGIPCHFLTDHSVTIKEKGMAHQLYRIAQEAIHNSIKHSKAKAMRMELRQEEGALKLTVVDLGIGFPLSAGKGAGAGQRIMRYRSEMIGATLKIESVVGEGTTVTCVCPLNRERVEDAPDFCI